jgi:hypothetical protein
MAGLDNALTGVKRWIETNLLLDTVRVQNPASGDPVLNPDTGQLEYPEGSIVYEGPGAVQSANDLAGVNAIPDVGQPWLQETESRYVLLTPLEAPIPPKDAIVSVTGLHDPSRTGLLGRTWLCTDPGIGGTVEVVRRTVLDQKRVRAGGTG